jgi:3',5'-cyclic AMP phosphodiesterase CpdA
MRAEMRFMKAGYSLPTAMRIGLKFGLPWSALLAAVMPVLGMSWYFDTENWASGSWDKWAAARADEWRMAITKNSGEGFGANAFRLFPQGVNQTDDFSFVVIGDPGEGDASQLILKDQIIAVSNQPDVKFVVISSDVVYPTGALKDYEKKFWMPFKGVTKPVYAIPGNHDWYDALDGFIATFYEPEAAKNAMRERVKADLKFTTTTNGLIDEMIQTSATWRKEYEVPTGFQKAPYFQLSTDEFVFVTIETGMLRQIDSLQRHWLNNVLEASKGKFVMVLLGHPFYAIGEYEGSMNPDFDSIHALLRKHKVPLVMAGDTHDLEYYNEPPDNTSTSTMHHFVNGGGGAYLSIGAAMAPEGSMPTKDFAFYPSHDPLVKKIEENTSWYKKPAWWWTTQLHGWPFSAEWLSAMFDYNVSPYFQSFIKIKVEPSKKSVTLIPYSNHGRIPWRDMMSTEGARPQGASMDDFAEWVIPIE